MSPWTFDPISFVLGFPAGFFILGGAIALANRVSALLDRVFPE